MLPYLHLGNSLLKIRPRRIRLSSIGISKIVSCWDGFDPPSLARCFHSMSVVRLLPPSGRRCIAYTLPSPLLGLWSSGVSFKPQFVVAFLVMNSLRRGIADQLTASGEPVTDSDLVRYILNGLGSDFNSFIVAITTRSEPLSLSDLHGFLLTHEALLTSQHHPISAQSADPAAYYAHSNRGRVAIPLDAVVVVAEMLLLIRFHFYLPQ